MSNMAIRHEPELDVIWQVVNYHKQSDKAHGPLVEKLCLVAQSHCVIKALSIICIKGLYFILAAEEAPKASTQVSHMQRWMQQNQHEAISCSGYCGFSTQNYFLWATHVGACERVKQAKTTGRYTFSWGMRVHWNPGINNTWIETSAVTE